MRPLLLSNTAHTLTRKSGLFEQIRTFCTRIGGLLVRKESSELDKALQTLIEYQILGPLVKIANKCKQKRISFSELPKNTQALILQALQTRPWSSGQLEEILTDLPSTKG